MRSMKMYVHNYRMLNGHLPQVSQCSDKPFTDAESYVDVNEF